MQYATGNGLDPAPQPGEADASETSDLTGLLRRYYRNSTIRERMYEFLGGADLRPSAVYIVGNDGLSDSGRPSSTACLSEILGAGLEVDRSLWDRDSLIADIDLEYHNFDVPVVPWLDPEGAFKLQQPVLDATLRILGQAGIAPLTLVSGRGFHLVWAISRKSRAFHRLAGLGRVPTSLQARYARSCSPGGLSVDPDLGRAFAGLGLIVEFIGHRVAAASTATCILPVQLTAIEVGPGIAGREIVSFDISEYGDPLHMRHVRLPFSAYLKPMQFQWLLGEAGVRRLLPIFTIPLSGMTMIEAIQVARNPDEVLELSRHVSTRIPNESAAMDTLLDEYQDSELAAFHDRFYRELQELPPGPRGAGSVQIPGAPPCVQWILDQPNDWLLKPAALQHVVRVLTALDWSPASVSQVICDCYESDSGWGDFWVRLDPRNRAIFYTRLFSGMIATGTDKLIDMNCVSHKEKGYCVTPECFSNLVQFRDALLERRQP